MIRTTVRYGSGEPAVAPPGRAATLLHCRVRGTRIRSAANDETERRPAVDILKTLNLGLRFLLELCLLAALAAWGLTLPAR